MAFFVGEARYLIEQGRDNVRSEIRNRVSEVQLAIAEHRAKAELTEQVPTQKPPEKVAFFVGELVRCGFEAAKKRAGGRKTTSKCCFSTTGEVCF